jgi:plastocyanin
LQRVRILLALLIVGVVGAGAAFAIPAIGAHSTAAKTVTIKVTASEWKFKLSRTSVPVGTTVIFKVTNKGQIAHDFKINGKKTPLIAKGKTKSIKVVFKKKGRLTFLCTVKGHAKLGMAGKFSVGVKPVTTTTTTTTTTTGGGGGGGGACTTPTTTVNVRMRDFVFELDKTSVPAGCIQFVVTSVDEVHNFDLQGKHNGALLGAGQTETWAVQLTAGSYRYVCDVGQHQDFGMVGNLAVT